MKAKSELLLLSSWLVVFVCQLELSCLFSCYELLCE